MKYERNGEYENVNTCIYIYNIRYLKWRGYDFGKTNILSILMLTMLKATVITGRTCLVIVRVLRVLPVAAPVVDHSVKNHIEVTANAT